MAGDYGALSVAVTANTGPAERQIRSNLTAAGDSVGRAMAGRIGNALASATRDIGRGLATGLGVATAATAALGFSAVKAGVQYNILSQKSTAAFKTILGSSAAASKMMADIAAFASESPFPRQAFIEASQQMLSFGIETKKVIPYLGAMQDAVAATGGGTQQLKEISLIMSQISAAGKITGVDLMQFAQRGINAAELIGSAMGKTGPQIRQMITDGTLDAGKALDALVAGMNKKFGGAAANVKQTWVGATDRIKGAMRDIGSAIAAPFIDPKGGGLAVEWANKFASMLRAVQRLVGPIMSVIGKALAEPLSKIGPLFDRITTSIDTIARYGPKTAAFKKTFADLLPVIGALSAGFAGFAAKGLLAAIPGFGLLAAKMSPVLIGLTALVALSPDLRGVFSDFGKSLQPALGPLKDLAVTLGTTFMSMVKRLAPALSAIATTIGTTFANIITVVAPILERIGSLISDAFVRLAPIVQRAVEVIGQVVTSVITAVAPAFETLAEAVLKAGGPFDILVGLIGDAASAMQLISPILTGIASVVGLLADAFSALPAPIQAVVVAIGLLKFTSLGAAIAGFASKLSGVVSGPLTAFKGFMADQSSVMDKAGYAFSTFGSKVSGGLRSAFAGIAGLVSPMNVALAGGVVILGILAAGQARAAAAAQAHKAAISTLTSALIASKGAMDASVKDSIIKQASDAKASGKLEQLKLNQAEFFQALTSGGPALEAYRAQLEDSYKNGLLPAQAATHGNVDALTDLIDVVLGAGAGFDEYERNATAAGTASAAVDPQVKAIADSMRTFADATSDAATQSNALATALLALGGGQLSAQDAAIAGASAIRSLESAFNTASGASTSMASAFVKGTTTIDTQSQAAATMSNIFKSEVTPAFAQQVTAAFDAAGGYSNLTAASTAAESAAGTYDKSLIKQAGSLGITEGQMQALIRQYHLTPADVKTLVTAPGAVEAANQANGVNTAITNIPTSKTIPISAVDATQSAVASANAGINGLPDSKTITIFLKTVGSMPLGGAPSATGGLIRGRGGIDNVPIWATSGEFMIRRMAAKSLGLGLLSYLNYYGKLPGYQHGGQVSAPRASTFGMANGGTVQQTHGWMPDTLVVVDQDGQLIGRMRVEAQSQIDQQARQLRLAGKR